MSTGKLPQQPVRKISSTKSPGSGILVNKPTTAPKPAPPSNGSIESLNSFDKSHPKDDLEIKKHRDESLGRTMNNSKKDHKNGKTYLITLFTIKIRKFINLILLI